LPRFIEILHLNQTVSIGYFMGSEIEFWTLHQWMIDWLILILEQGLDGSPVHLTQFPGSSNCFCVPCTITWQSVDPQKTDSVTVSLLDRPQHRTLFRWSNFSAQDTFFLSCGPKSLLHVTKLVVVWNNVVKFSLCNVRFHVFWQKLLNKLEKIVFSWVDAFEFGVAWFYL